MIRRVALPGGETVPALGQGTWMMGEDRTRRAAEMETLQAGADAGMTLIDTAEMYGEGAAEMLVAEALGHRRGELFIVSKVYPQNAGRDRLPQACEASLRRLGTDRLDLYLLHWRGSVPLSETVEAMETLRVAGKIRHWGVSNLDAEGMEQLLQAGGEACATDQILYNLARRGPEHDLLPWLGEHRMTAMAYSPVEQGGLLRNPALKRIAHRLSATPAQVALAWILRRPDMIAIPKAGTIAHTLENAGAAELELDARTLRMIDEAFPAPTAAQALEML